MGIESWSEETTVPPNPFPAKRYNQGKQVTGGLFPRVGAVRNEKRRAGWPDTIPDQLGRFEN